MKAVAVFENDSGQNDQNQREHAISLLRIFERHLQNDVPRVAATVDHFFQETVKIVQKNDLLRGVIAFEKITKALQFELVGIAFYGLQFGVHLARGASVDPVAQLFYHRQHRFGGLIEQLDLLTETLPCQIFRADQNAFANFLDRFRYFI